MASYVPRLPFDGYKWYWACKAPTEALNDPAVLLGVLRIIDNLADRGFRYSSPAFSDGLRELAADVSETTVNLAGRVGERNLIRNSGQYWRLLGLIPHESHGGAIEITEFGRAVARGDVEQGDFAAVVIAALTLPNATSYTPEEIALWRSHNLLIHPLRLLLDVLRNLNHQDMGWLSVDEVAKIVVPMSGEQRSAEAIADYIVRARSDETVIDGWPNCAPRSNDLRFIREFLLFLAHYGYVSKTGERRSEERFVYLSELDEEIGKLISGDVNSIGLSEVQRVAEMEISAAVTSAVSIRRSQRPGQARFRQELLASIGRCPLTNVDLPDVLEAAHIKPHAYGGPESQDNGWPMRVDIHRLFDSGKLRVRPDGNYGVIEFTNPRAEKNYRELVGHAIKIPEQTNLEFVRWRYENYTVGMSVEG